MVVLHCPKSRQRKVIPGVAQAPTTGLSIVPSAGHGNDLPSLAAQLDVRSPLLMGRRGDASRATDSWSPRHLPFVADSPSTPYQRLSARAGAESPTSGRGTVARRPKGRVQSTHERRVLELQHVGSSLRRRHSPSQGPAPADVRGLARRMFAESSDRSIVRPAARARADRFVRPRAPRQRGTIVSSLGTKRKAPQQPRRKRAKPPADNVQRNVR